MTRICPSCGTPTQPEARFCRKCGSSVRDAGGDGTSDLVSPQAATIPLREQARTTDGLAADDSRRAAPETTRVGRAELDSILQGAEREHGTDPNALDEEDFMKTRPAINREYDEEETVIAVRPFSEGATPRPVQRVPTTGPLANASEPAFVPPQEAQTPAPSLRKGNTWAIIIAVCASFLLVAALGTWLAVKYLRGPAEEASAAGPAAPVPEDQRRLAEQKVSEAERMRASGDTGGALAALREAVQLDPHNARAHRRFGDLLWETGARREAIDELRKATVIEPNDFTHWRALASAQLADGLAPDAAASYRRLLDITGGSDPNDQLSYAHALRLSGRTDEARAIYERLSTSQVAEVAASARQHLAELASATQAPTPDEAGDTREGEGETADSTTQPGDASASATPESSSPPQPAPQPTPQAEQSAQLSPDERYRRGVDQWTTNRATALADLRAAAVGGHTDAHYYVGLSYVEGKDLRSLSRSDLLAALRNFQVAQRGSHAAQSRRYVQQLEKEYDRIRSQR